MTVSGTNFEPIAGMNAAAVNYLRANVTSASPTSISIAVPPASSGHVSVVTPAGAATTSGYYFIAPPPLAASDIVDTDAMTIGGPAVSVTVQTAGKDALIAFDGIGGQRVSWRFPSVSISATARNPGSGRIAPPCLADGVIGHVLRAAHPARLGYVHRTHRRRHRIDRIRFGSGLSRARRRDDDDDHRRVPGHRDHDRPGPERQGVLRRYERPAGELAIGTVNYSTSTTILNPDGSVFRTTDSGTSSGEFFDALILPQTGTYTLTVNGAGANVGSLSVRAYLVPDDATTTMTIGGSQVTVTTTVPGQNAKVFFDGTSGQRVSWLFGTVNYSTSTTILNPDGSVFRTTDSGTSSGEFFDALILPQTGTYTLTVNGAGANVGSLSVRAYLVPDDATTTMTIGGSQVTVTTTVPGQNAKVFFDGTSGQRVSWLFGTVNYSTSTTILNPDGSVFRTTDSGTSSGEFFDALILPQTGTYTLTVNGAGANVGSLSVRAYNASIVTQTITIGGSPTTVTMLSPGQDANVTFSGSSGQAIRLVLSAVSITQSDVSILKPDGTTLVAPTLVTTTGKTINTTLTSTGTHTIVVNPRAAFTGSMTLTLSLQMGFALPSIAFARRNLLAPLDRNRRPATRASSRCHAPQTEATSQRRPWTTATIGSPTPATDEATGRQGGPTRIGSPSLRSRRPRARPPSPARSSR